VKKFTFKQKHLARRRRGNGETGSGGNGVREKRCQVPFLAQALFFGPKRDQSFPHIHSPHSVHAPFYCIFPKKVPDTFSSVGSV
jgi:hypothetical protein